MLAYYYNYYHFCFIINLYLLAMSNEVLFFLGFIVFIGGILVFDMKFVGKNSHVVEFKEAAIWSTVWISLGLVFYFFLYFWGETLHGITDLASLKEIVSKYAPEISNKLTGNYEESIGIFRQNQAIAYLTGYLIEYTLSVDNIFVIMMILTAFNVEQKNYKHVLFWGILGAIVLRCGFIFAGSALVQKFQFILYIFGAFLIYTGTKMFLQKDKEEKIDTHNHPVVKLLTRTKRVFPQYVNDRFFVRENGRKLMTPLFIVLMIIEFTDLIFALDSIPAIFAVSTDPYIVFFSNIFAIIGLRSLFFMLIKVIDKFHFIKYGVSILLVFVGVKLVAHHYLEMIGFTSVYSLYFILFVIVASVVLSILFPKKEKVNA